MNLYTLLTSLWSRRIRLTVVDGKLQVHPASGLAPDEHTFLALHWREVVELLQAHPAAAPGCPPEKFEPVWVVLRCTDPSAVGGKWCGSRWCPPPSPPEATDNGP